MMDNQAKAPPQSATAVALQAAAATPGLLLRVEALLTRLEAKAKADEASGATWFGKYWPIALGAVIAATRFL